MTEGEAVHIDFAFRALRADNASPEEQRIVCLWAAARTTMDAAEKSVEVYFMGRLDSALQRHNYVEAEALMMRCPPDTVTRVFMMDRIREARKSKSK